MEYDNENLYQSVLQRISDLTHFERALQCFSIKQHNFWKLYCFNDMKLAEKTYQCIETLNSHDSSKRKKQNAVAWLLNKNFKDFYGMSLQNTALIRSDLSYADLRSVCMKSNNLTETYLYQADLKKANLQWANLCKAILTGADLRYASLRQVSLYHTNLEKADLRWCYMFGSDFEGARLQGANLSFAYLGKATRITPLQLSECFCVENVFGLGREFLEELQKINPPLMQWWDGNDREMLVRDWRKLFKRSL